jgi:hypothetical protein
VEGGSANNYDYVGQDPVNRTDLSGTVCFSCLAGKLRNLFRCGCQRQPSYYRYVYGIGDVEAMITSKTARQGRGTWSGGK